MRHLQDAAGKDNRLQAKLNRLKTQKMFQSEYVS